VVIEKALAGDAVAARFVVALISPKPRGRTIHLDMPEDDDCNVVTAFNVTLRALCEGEITPDEALQVSRFLDGRRRTLQAWQLEEKLTSYGRTIPGDPEWAREEEDEEEEDEDEDEDEDTAPAMRAEPEAVASSVASETAPPSAQQLPQSDASPLQSACIWRSPGMVRDLVPAPAGEFDAALAASVARRLRGRSFAR
jgi:hypothetical protein